MSRFSHVVETAVNELAIFACIHSFPRQWFVLVFALLLASIAGCGADRYDGRLRDNTIPYFNDLAELNANLSGEWTAGTVQIRLPKGFAQNTTRNDQDITIPIPGEQQLALPGIEGVFHKLVGAEMADGGTLEVPAYIVVLTNEELLRKKNNTDSATPRVSAADYSDFIRNALLEVLPNRTPHTNSILVGGDNFQPTLRYDKTEYTESSNNDSGQTVTLYTTTNPQTNVQLGFVVIAPKLLVRSEPLEKQAQLSLRTAQFEAPRAAAQPGGASTPASSSGPSF